jgi:hypothetical protein
MRYEFADSVTRLGCSATSNGSTRGPTGPPAADSDSVLSNLNSSYPLSAGFDSAAANGPSPTVTVTAVTVARSQSRSPPRPGCGSPEAQRLARLTPPAGPGLRVRPAGRTSALGPSDSEARMIASPFVAQAQAGRRTGIRPVRVGGGPEDPGTT